MKKFYLSLTLLLFSLNIFCQSVGINNTVPDNSAILDVKSTNKGMLVPRMNTAQRTGIATPATGLLVYDTDTNSFWFYNGAAWTNLSTAASAGWLLTGNSGINPANNYIGTTDAQPLRFRINNLWAGEIHPANGNIFLGLSAGQSNTVGVLNTSLGIAALKNNSSGSENVAIGDSSLYSQNGTGTNVAVGTHTLYKNTSGNANTAIGPYALNNNADGAFNTAIGTNSLANNISGTENTAVGTRALQFTTGSFNTATGASSLRFSSGGYNTANGYQSLYSNTTGFYNTATGFQSLYSNSSGSWNTAHGFQSLFSNTTGTENTATGFASLSLNTTGTKNTAFGNSALYANTYSVSNTAVGCSALYSNTSGNSNTATGNAALFYNTSAGGSCAFGNESLYSNTTGSTNNAFGYQAMYSNTTGFANNATGFTALRSNTTGSFNTAYGDAALYNLVSGQNNIAIGSGSGTDPGSPGISNTISIGNNGILNAASNQAFIGNMSTAWIGGHVGWSTYSDQRIKNNIREEVKGLDFIMRLRPVTYYKSLAQMRAITGNKDISDFPGKYDVEKIKFSGFLAQEVEKAATDAGYDFSGIGVPKSPDQLYTLSYEQFVVPLVKAMQEQQATIEDMKKEIEALKKLIKKEN